MTEGKKGDAVVIGGGPAGYVCAIRLGQLGKKVLLVEKASLGGVCLNVGCIPSKALITASKTAEQIRKADEMGIGVSGVNIDMGKLQDWKGQIVNRLTGGVAQLLKANGVKVLEGTATLKNRETVHVDSPDGPVTVQASNIVLATGSRPIQIPAFPFDEDSILSSTGALAQTKLPPRLLCIGGGYIGLEIGTMFARLGSEVTVVEMTDQLLPGMDKDMVKVVHRNLKKRKVTVLLNAKAEGFDRSGGGIQVGVTDKKGTHTIECDKVLVSVGRSPNTANLNLEEIGVKVDERGFIPTDEQGRSNIPNIFAIGDIAPGFMLAHKGSKEGEVVAEVIAGKKGAAKDVRAMPAVVFTDPEIGSVGLTEDQAQEQGLEYKVGTFPFAASGRAMTTRQTDGMVKILADAKSDRLLGVHVVGPEASDLIAEAALAIEMGATAEDIALTVHAHPTLAEAMMEAAKAVHGEAIHALTR